MLRLDSNRFINHTTNGGGDHSDHSHHFESNLSHNIGSWTQGRQEAGPLIGGVMFSQIRLEGPAWGTIIFYPTLELLQAQVFPIRALHRHS
jgi:hypothetical protein